LKSKTADDYIDEDDIEIGSHKVKRRRKLDKMYSDEFDEDGRMKSKRMRETEPLKEQDHVFFTKYKEEMEKLQSLTEMLKNQ
jgi:hypothetical protein